MMTEFCEEDLLINDNELKADDVFAVMGAVENLETNKRSCDSSEITNDHNIGGYLHHHISGNDINQQQLSVHNPQLNQQHDLNDEEFHDSPASSQSAPVKRHKREFVWLEVIGEPCHSEKQESSGSDLTHVKKKYKKMHCLYCSQYNPRTPWATVKSRKFEIDGFAEHERSAHHLKALAVKDGTNPLLMNSDLRHGNQMMGSGRGLMAQNYGAAVALMRSNQQSQQQQQMTQLQQNANQAQHNQLSQYHLDNVQLQQQHQQQQQHLRQQQHQQQQQQQAMQLHQMQLTAQQQGRVMANNGNTAQVLSAAVSQDDDSDDSSDEDDLAVLSRGSSATMSAAGLPVNLIPVNVNNGGNELTPQQIMLLHAQQQQQIYQQQQQQHIHHQQQSLHQQNHNHQQQHMQQLNHQSQLQLPANMLQQPQQNNNGNNGGAAAANASSNLHQQQQQQVASSELFPVNALSLAESKTKCMPEWLRVEGKLCFSDKQGDGASMLSSAKKKYKLVMCVYCREFNPSSPWAMLKARKFETSVILEHERSHNHKKAVNMREAAICARQLQQLHAPDYVPAEYAPAEYAPADYLQHQMDALESGGAQQQHLSVAGLGNLAGMSQISESQALQQLQQQQAQAAQAQQVLAQQQMRQAAELQLHQQQQQQQQQAQQVQLQTQQQSQHQQTQQTQQQQAQAQAQHYHQLAQQLHHQQHLQQQLLQQQHQQQYGSQHHCHNQLQQLQQQQQQQLLRQHQQILQLQQLQHQQQGPLGGVMHGQQQQGHLVIVQPQHGPQLHLMDGGDEDLEDELDEAESDAALLAAHFQSQDQDSESQDYETQGSETQEEDQDDDDLCLDIDSLTPRTPLARHR